MIVTNPNALGNKPRFQSAENSGQRLFSVTSVRNENKRDAERAHTDTRLESTGVLLLALASDRGRNSQFVFVAHTQATGSFLTGSVAVTVVVGCSRSGKWHAWIPCTP